jgi:hypothetical protein
LISVEKKKKREYTFGMYCSKCGKELRDGEKFCGACGTAVGTNGQNLTLPSSHYSELDPKQFYGNEQYATNLRDSGGWGWWLLGLLLGFVGLILYFVWRRDYPNRARSVLRGFFCGVVAEIVMYFFFYDELMKMAGAVFGLL